MYTLSSFLLTGSIKNNSQLLLSETLLAQAADGCQMHPEIPILLMTPVGGVMIPQNLVQCFHFALLKT